VQRKSHDPFQQGERRIETSATVSEAAAKAFENAKDLQKEAFASLLQTA
jgi:hypothetical protein